MLGPPDLQPSSGDQLSVLLTRLGDHLDQSNQAGTTTAWTNQREGTAQQAESHSCLGFCSNLDNSGICSTH